MCIYEVWCVHSQLCHLLLNHHCVFDAVIHQLLLLCLGVEVGMWYPIRKLRGFRRQPVDQGSL